MDMEHCKETNEENSVVRSTSSLTDSHSDSDAASSSDYDTDLESDIHTSVVPETTVTVSGEEHYIQKCTKLKIIPSQRILLGLHGQELQLKYRGVGNLGAVALASALIHNTTIEILNMEDNGIEEEGCVHIAQMLNVNSTITDLNLSKNRLGSLGAMVLAEMMVINCTVTHLDISANRLRDSDARHLAAGLECNEAIIWINISHNEFSQEGGQLLGHAIGANSKIENINMSWNHLRREGAVSICQAMKRSVSITTANMAWNGFGFEGAVAIGNLLRGNKCLRELDISNNRINWDGAALIAKGLKENDCLQILRIGGNPLTMTGCIDILESVDHVMSMTSHVGFDGIPVNRRVIFTMQCIQKRRPFCMSHGGLLESEDIFGQSVEQSRDPLRILIQFLHEKGIRPVELFRRFGKDKRHLVSRDQFVQGLRTIHAPLDNYEVERVINRLVPTEDDQISYPRLLQGFREQIKVNRDEERKRNVEHNKKTEDRKRIMRETSTLPPIAERSLNQSFSSLRYRYGSGGSVRSMSTDTTRLPQSIRCTALGSGSTTSVVSKRSAHSLYRPGKDLYKNVMVSLSQLRVSKVNMSAPLSAPERVVDSTTIQRKKQFKHKLNKNKKLKTVKL